MPYDQGGNWSPETETIDWMRDGKPRDDHGYAILTRENQSVFPHTRFFVDGEPKAQPRTRRSAQGGVYTPSTATGWRERLWSVGMPLRPSQPHVGAVEVILHFIMPRPKSHYGSGKNAYVVRAKHEDRRHLNVPDLDNLEKAVLDELTQMQFYRDDSQVWRVNKTKQWSDPQHDPGVEIIMYFNGAAV